MPALTMDEFLLMDARPAPRAPSPSPATPSVLNVVAEVPSAPSPHSDKDLRAQLDQLRSEVQRLTVLLQAISDKTDQTGIGQQSSATVKPQISPCSAVSPSRIGTSELTYAAAVKPPNSSLVPSVLLKPSKVATSDNSKRVTTKSLRNCKTGSVVQSTVLNINASAWDPVSNNTHSIGNMSSDYISEHSSPTCLPNSIAASVSSKQAVIVVTPNQKCSGTPPKPTDISIDEKCSAPTCTPVTINIGEIPDSIAANARSKQVDPADTRTQKRSLEAVGTAPVTTERKKVVSFESSLFPEYPFQEYGAYFPSLSREDRQLACNAQVPLERDGQVSSHCEVFDMLTLICMDVRWSRCETEAAKMKLISEYRNELKRLFPPNSGRSRVAPLSRLSTSKLQPPQAIRVVECMPATTKWKTTMISDLDRSIAIEATEQLIRDKLVSSSCRPDAMLPYLWDPRWSPCKTEAIKLQLIAEYKSKLIKKYPPVAECVGTDQDDTKAVEPIKLSTIKPPVEKSAEVRPSTTAAATKGGLFTKEACKAFFSSSATPKRSVAKPTSSHSVLGIADVTRVHQSKQVHEFPPPATQCVGTEDHGEGNRGNDIFTPSHEPAD